MPNEITPPSKRLRELRDRGNRSGNPEKRPAEDSRAQGFASGPAGRRHVRFTVPFSHPDGEGPSATTPAQDQLQEIFQNSTLECRGEINKAMAVINTSIKDGKAPNAFKSKFQALHFQLIKRHFTANGALKTYKDILGLIPTLSLTKDKLAEVQHLLTFQGLIDSPQPGHGVSEGSRYAEQGRTGSS